MSLYVDKVYVNLLSPRLDRFQRKSDDLWNFRCPICGDSQKNKFKCRGYIYRRKQELRFSCKNCGAGESFSRFLKTVDPILYADYNMELFKEKASPTRPEFKPTEEELNKSRPVFAVKTKKIELPTIESLPYNHYGKRYLIDRKLPKDVLSRCYWTQDFKEFVREMVPESEKSESLHPDEPRIIIPFYSEDGEVLLGFQGRSMDPKSKAKYITMKITRDNKKVYGLERMDRRKKVYVVEGPFDSEFLKNGIATMDSTLYSIIPVLGGNLDYTFVFDNQPRNKDVVNTMARSIRMGHNICIWPKGIPEKDINDMILAGSTPAQVQDMIDRNTHQGLSAELELSLWRKI